MSEQQPPEGWDDFGHINETALADGTVFTDPSADLGPATFLTQPLDAYTVIDEQFVIDDDALAAWYAANTSLGEPVSITYIAGQHQAAAATSSLTRRLVDGARRSGRGMTGGRFILDELTRRKAEQFVEQMKTDPIKFTLLKWQEDAVRRMFGLDVEADDDRVHALISGPMYLGPVVATYDHFVDWQLPDAVLVSRKVDPEMLNRVIDDLGTDVNAKIARTECPKFPRADA